VGKREEKKFDKEGGKDAAAEEALLTLDEKEHSNFTWKGVAISINALPIT